MKYDVDVFITTDTPPDDNNFCCGPLSGGLCKAYALVEKAANECKGGWEDWEPYRCTFAFNSEEQQNNFCKIMETRKEILNHWLTYEKR